MKLLVGPPSTPGKFLARQYRFPKRTPETPVSKRPFPVSKRPFPVSKPRFGDTKLSTTKPVCTRVYSFQGRRHEVLASETITMLSEHCHKTNNYQQTHVNTLSTIFPTSDRQMATICQTSVEHMSAINHTHVNKLTSIQTYVKHLS